MNPVFLAATVIGGAALTVVFFLVIEVIYEIRDRRRS
jgi:hypothetical protein